MGHLNTSARLLLHAPLLLLLGAPFAGALGVPSVDSSVDLDLGVLRVEAAAEVEPLALEPTSLLPALPSPQADLLPSAPDAAGLPIVHGPPSADSLAAAPAIPAPLAPAPAAAAGTALAWILLERLGFARVLVGLYSRLAPSKLLEHERRERVLMLIRERPGIGPQDIATALGAGWGVTLHHLRKLEDAGLIASQRSGHHRCYFVAGAVGREKQQTASLFRIQTTRRIAELVATQPGLTQSQAASVLGLTASAMSKQVARLEAAALLRREASAGAQRLYPEPTLAGALAC